jgi:hypothetical protein
MVHGGNLLKSDNCGFATYECRTVYDTELADNQWKRAEQSMACRTRENQLLMKQRDEARERIKRLEEGGDEAIYPFEYAARVRIWTEAKEVKP